MYEKIIHEKRPEGQSNFRGAIISEEIIWADSRF